MFFNYINEVYFGKQKELIDMENILDDVRKQYSGQYLLFKNININSDKRIQKFNRMMEDFFGFGTFALSIQNIAAANAMTCPISGTFDFSLTGKNSLENGKYFKYKKNKDYAAMVVIWSGLFFNPGLTSEEIMAIILHEVGHNFSCCINGRQGILNNTYFIILGICNIIYIINGNNSFDRISMFLTNNSLYRKTISNIEKDLRTKNSIIISIIDFANQIKNLKENGYIIYSDILSVASFGTLTIIWVLNSISRRMMRIVTDPLGFIEDLLTTGLLFKTDEKIADNFCSMYGYGPSLSSALHKLHTAEGDAPRFTRDIINKIPIIGALFNMVELPAYIISGLFNEHPEYIKRSKDQISFLKYELTKNDIDPKMKKRIQDDIEKCEIAIDKMTNAESLVTDPYIARKMFNSLLDKFTNSNVFTKEQEKRFKSYDDSFNSIKFK